MNEEYSRLASSVARNLQALMGNSGGLPPSFLNTKLKKEKLIGICIGLKKKIKYSPTLQNTF